MSCWSGLRLSMFDFRSVDLCHWCSGGKRVPFLHACCIVSRERRFGRSELEAICPICRLHSQVDREVGISHNGTSEPLRRTSAKRRASMPNWQNNFRVRRDRKRIATDLRGQGLRRSPRPQSLICIRLATYCMTSESASSKSGREFLISVDTYCEQPRI